MSADLDAALVYAVTHASGVTALISTRFYPMRLPETVTMPAATYQMVGGGSRVGQHRAPSLLPRQRVQLTVFGSFADCVAIDRALRVALDGFRGTWGTGATATAIESCMCVSGPVDDADPEAGLVWRSRDYFIMWKE